MWLHSFWGHICARTCMHTFLEGVTSNSGCLRGKIGVVIKKDFSLIPRFYFLKAEYIWVLFLQLDSKFKMIFKKEKAHLLRPPPKVYLFDSSALTIPWMPETGRLLTAILSSQFEWRLRFSLPFRSGTGSSLGWVGKSFPQGWESLIFSSVFHFFYSFPFKCLWSIAFATSTL